MLEECLLELVDGLCRSRRDLEVVDCGLLVCSGLKQDEVTESSDVSTSDRGAKTLDVYSSKLFNVKLSTLMLSHLQQCQMTLERPRYDMFFDERSSHDL